MLKIILYQEYCVLLREHINPYSYRKDQIYRTYRCTTSAIGRRLSQRQELCIPYVLSSGPLEIIGFDIVNSWRTDRNDTYISQFVGEAFRVGKHQGIRNPSRSWAQAYNGLLRRGSSTGCHRERQTEHEESQGSLATGIGQKKLREYLQSFFIRISARYRRIRKRPKGKTVPQLYAYKTEKLQKLEQQANDGLIDLYFADESHICTEEYVPYGWQFPGEDVFAPSRKSLRINIFGMIYRNNRYDCFCTIENITADKVADFLDRLSLRIKKNTFVVLDNARVHRCKLMGELRQIWEKRGLFFCFLPPYSLHLNRTETLWRILKG